MAGGKLEMVTTIKWALTLLQLIVRERKANDPMFLIVVFRKAAVGCNCVAIVPRCGTVTGPRPCVSAELVITVSPLETFFPCAPR